MRVRKNFVLSTAIITATLAMTPYTMAETQLQLNDLEYVGAFRVSIGTYGVSKVNWSKARIAISPNTHTFFMNGSNGFAIAEFNIPEIRSSKNIEDLAFTGPPKQNFVDISTKGSTGNPQKLDRITGMRVVDNKLVVNGAEYYDAPGDNTHTTLVLDNAFDLENTIAIGFTKLEGHAHSAGWLTHIPDNLQNDLGGDYITGFSSVFSIDSRNSIGPTAFVTNMSDILTADADSTIQATPLLDFSLSHPITDKPNYNYLDKAGQLDSALWDEKYVSDNDLWTVISAANFGMIVPGTSTYFTIGSSGGHEKGIGYKINQVDKPTSSCGGPCSFYTWDNYNYAWLFDVQDLIDVKNGAKSPHEIKPYSYGKIPIQFEDPDNDGVNSLIASADYDPVNQLLYITLSSGDRMQSEYDPVPLVVVYKYLLNRPHSPTDLAVM